MRGTKASLFDDASRNALLLTCAATVLLLALFAVVYAPARPWSTGAAPAMHSAAGTAPLFTSYSPGTAPKFKPEVEELSKDVLQVRFYHNRLDGGEALEWSEVVDLLQAGEEAGKEFRALLTQVLQQCRFKAFFWETRPVSRATAAGGRTFTFVLVNAPALANIPEDPAPFREHLESRCDGEAPVAVFDNLGGDARLVAPCRLRARLNPRPVYAHFAAMLRSAPQHQVEALWRAVGRSVAERLADAPALTPMWVSTSGLGVAWLHVRIDAFPKYYQYQPFTVDA